MPTTANATARGPEPLWRDRDVARYLSLSPRTIRSYRLAGLIPYVTTPAGYRFKPESVRAWVEASEVWPLGSRWRR